MQERSYYLKGDPIPLARPRIGNSRAWDSQKSHKVIKGLELAGQHIGEKFSGPLVLEVTFYIQIPQSWSKSRRESYVNKPHVSKPDTSNLIKFVEDVATGILYSDDALIVHIIATKLYALEPSTTFTLREFKHG